MTTQISGDTGVSQCQTDSVSTNDIQASAVTPAKLSQPMTLATAQTAPPSPDAKFFDFLNIPSWAKRITVTFSSVSTSGTLNVICRLGDSSGFATTGYNGNTTLLTNAGAVSVSDVNGSISFSSTSSAASNISGQIIWTKLDGNTWVGSSICRSSQTTTTIAAASVTLPGTLDRLRITTGGAGTDTFDAGSINILYEG